MNRDRTYHQLASVIFLPAFFLVCLTTNAQTVTYSDTLVHTDEQQGGNNSSQTENYFLNKPERPFQTDSFQLRQLPAKELKRLQEDDAFWYANANIKKKTEERTGTSLGNLKWLSTLLWLIIIGGFAAFIMIYLSNSNISLFGRKNKPIADAAGEETETENIFAINYQREIDKAVKNENYRLAVRLLFLRLLRKLSDKHIIQYKQDNTNFDYLLQLGPTAYYRDFFRITRNYEYSWYGQFDVTPETFSVIQKDVESFENTLK